MARRKRENSVRVLLRVTAFRRLWSAIALGSLGDWLGLLATTSLAFYLTEGSSASTQGTAVSAVLITRLLPDLLLAPVAGSIVDRFDRRKVAIVGDTLVGLLYLTIALTFDIRVLLIAQFLAEAIGLFVIPAKQALWVNVVPRERLAVANQLNYVSIYGMVPIAALVFALLSTAAQFFGARKVPSADGTLTATNSTSTAAIFVALVINAGTFFFSVLVVYFTRRKIPAFVGERPVNRSVFALVREGLSYIRNSTAMRALYVGILGAFFAGGLVAGVAQPYVQALGAGSAGYSILFGSVFTGLALGMLIGPKVAPAAPRRVIFTSSIGVAGVALTVMCLVQDFIGAVLCAAVMGVFAGIAWITGFTMIGHEVSDQLRGRVFAFVMSSVRLVLLGTIALAPLLAGVIGTHVLSIGAFDLMVSGPAAVLGVGGLCAVAISALAARGIRSRWGLWALLRANSLFNRAPDRPGLLIAVEGSAESVVTSYRIAVAEYLSAQGLPTSQFVLSRWQQEDAESPAAALAALAALAKMAETDLDPALTDGKIVVVQDYCDPIVVRFGAVGEQHEERMIRMVRWAAGDNQPDLTLVVETAPVEQPRKTRHKRQTGGRSGALMPSQVAATSGAAGGMGDLSGALAPVMPRKSDLSSVVDEEPVPIDEGPGPKDRDLASVHRDLVGTSPERYLLVEPLTETGIPESVQVRLNDVVRANHMMASSHPDSEH